MKLVVFTVLMLFFDQSAGYSIDCKSEFAKNRIRQCTRTAHDFQRTHLNIDGDQWLQPSISRQINQKCDEAMSCLEMLGNCSVFEDDDILWLDDFCDAYKFLTGDFHECALKIDKNYEEPCVQHYLVNSPYFTLPLHERCSLLKSDGECVKNVVESTCSSGFADDFQQLLDRQMLRLEC